MSFKSDDGFRLYSVEEVPQYVREPFIHSGYRGRCGTAAKCIRATLFVRSNETLNVWTHLVPAIYFAWTAVSWWFAEKSLPVSSLLALAIYLSTVCAVPVTSAMAHLFSCASDAAWHLCFFADYAALSAYAVGVAVAYRFFAFPSSLLGGWYSVLYVPLAGVVAVASLAGSCRSRFLPDGAQRKAVRFVSLALPYLFDIAPVAYGLLSDSVAFGSSRLYHQRQFVAAIIAAIVYCLHLPERLFPGRFDFVGHSHQIFHIVASFGCRDQLLAILLTTNLGIQTDDVLSAANVIITILIVTAADVVILMYFFRQLRQTLKSRSCPSENGKHPVALANGHDHISNVMSEKAEKDD